MIVVDASVWVSRLFDADVNHEASRRWLVDQVANAVPLIGPALLLPEVAGAISRRSARPRLGRVAIAMLRRIPTLRLVSIDEQGAVIASELAARLALRGADAVYVATAHILGVPLVTWDAEQRDRGGRVIAVRTPADADSRPAD
ncbi:MAG: type II toxin-antitoxin system VapC family toxin [Candidatus Rokubacteria bacterium]|nr:type II toxin-antitoxin system VapC family toxin [Candidatus Rokubacteria bacterium]